MVIIKGMEMPQRCMDCGVDTGLCGLWNGYDGRYSRRHPKCPLVEIPTPPDDLVSREWIRDSINHSCWLEHNDYLEAVGIVDDAPNVIEAEGSKE